MLTGKEPFGGFVGLIIGFSYFGGGENVSGACILSTSSAEAVVIFVVALGVCEKH